jgi:hypothetical protein
MIEKMPGAPVKHFCNLLNYQKKKKSKTVKLSRSNWHQKCYLQLSL